MRRGGAAAAGKDAGRKAGDVGGSGGWVLSGGGAAEDSRPERKDLPAGGEPGAEEVRGEAGQAEHCAEGAADGDQHMGERAILSEDDHAAGDDDGAGGAYAEGGGKHLQDGGAVLGASAGGAEERGGAEVEGERGADGVSGAGQRVSRGERGGRECGAGIDDPEPALLGAGAVAGRRGGDAGRAEGGGGSGGRGGDGVHADGSLWGVLRGVEGGRRELAWCGTFCRGGWRRSTWRLRWGLRWGRRR